MLPGRRDRDSDRDPNLIAMRPLTESKTKWDETLKQSSTLTDLQRAVKFNGPTSPCVAGCRSVCWKAFLLFQNANAATWSHILLENRNAYSALREHHLKYIKHPELLNELSLDPLADDPDSPWNAVRKDHVIRSEIMQDVQRLPDEPFYHKETTQELILDVLFIWCKVNPDAGGYRQGMHELLAPLLYVIDQDAVDRKSLGGEMVDPVMVEMLDSYFVEHDAFALYSKIMERAKSFYEVSNGAGPAAGDHSAIVEKSKYIHETALMKIDPELAKHLANIEVLPQIFLIRWIRLLFGREFPFDQLLILWDTIFAFDPKLQLIDLICVAMLIRIRWTLLEADYSVALQVLLKYPAPQPPHGPHTLVDDAIYLKDHYNILGGSSIIMKYTGKAPAPLPSPDSRPSTPNSPFQGLSIRNRAHGIRSPITLPSKFIQQRGGMEALFQGAAKGVIERGEKLGINQAVRDAMGEIRRNMQDFQEARKVERASKDMFSNGFLVTPDGRTIADMERRNQQLALLLDEAVASLHALTASKLEGEKQQTMETIGEAAAKMQLVKAHLEDSTLELSEPGVAPHTPAKNKNTTSRLTGAEDEVMVDSNTTPKIGKLGGDSPSIPPDQADEPPSTKSPAMVETDDAMQTDSPIPENGTTQKTAALRPTPIPTRSTLAQSSFSWMLEPDITASAPSSLPSRFKGDSSQKKRQSNSVSRERNAFLFGEVTSAEGGSDRLALASDDIFGLQPVGKPKPKSKYEDLFGGALSDG